MFGELRRCAKRGSHLCLSFLWRLLYHYTLARRASIHWLAKMNFFFDSLWEIQVLHRSLIVSLIKNRAEYRVLFSSST